MVCFLSLLYAPILAVLYVAGEKMKNPVVIVGMGEMGGVFARGFLRAGYPVYPVVRGMEMEAEAEKITDPELVIIAVAEADLNSVLQQVPEAWRDRLVLFKMNCCPMTGCSMD